ncbi:MAG: hypothetical protein RMN52_17060 [Anaerolineae bacterium]|nr:hypothetical protein [Candidatus Roseilinea sp.]MDW8451708.1 hypothetical protein [Anaerolineae bacterium]
MLLEDDRSLVIPLDGAWHFRLGDGDWRTVRVPAAWEAETGDRLTEGPAIYRRTFTLDDPSGGRWLLECDAVGFAAIVRVNDRPAGAHTGMWSRWQVDVTPFLRAGENLLELEVWKPGEGRYKLRESLAGFLPDVCNTFGGIWQPIRLRRLAGPAITGLRVQSNARGVVRVDGRLVGVEDASRVTAGVARIDALGATAPVVVKDRGAFSATLRVDEHVRWSPETPQTYALAVELGGARVERRIGFRDVRARGEQTLLNGAPVHFRGVLDWGWDEKRLCPTPSLGEVRDAFATARRLGFNLFKLCLYVPDEAIFDVADETGMFLWLELPMWLPQVTPAFRVLALREYAAILRRVHHHPSIVIASLGCELGAEVDARFLAQLRDLARRWLPNALLCDNSGSGEAYGSLSDQGDFYDYHFYAELHQFEALNAHFARPYLPAKPWIYGEFCDADTMRDWSRLDAGAPPFWVTGPVTMQRDELTWAREHAQRLRAAGVADGGAALTRLGRLQATEVRKFILEQVRRRHATGGYVVTGWRDTPIATSGVVDDFGELKFNPDAWRRFNADRVLVMDRERRRRWVHGGDRPVYRDPCCWWSDEPLELHIALSNGAGPLRRAELRWRLLESDSPSEADVASQPGRVRALQRATAGAPGAAQNGVRALPYGSSTVLAEGVLSTGSIAPGAVREVGRIHIAPLDAAGEVNRLRVLRLEATLAAGGTGEIANAWTLCVAPAGLRQPAAALRQARCETDLDAVAARTRAGERVVLLAPRTSDFVAPCPFWREAIHVLAPELAAALGLPPDRPCIDARCYDLATDCAMDASRLAQRLGCDPAAVRPLWRRFDARAMTWREYVVEVALGAGRLVATTLGFDAPAGDPRLISGGSPMAAWVLAWLAG